MHCVCARHPMQLRLSSPQHLHATVTSQLTHQLPSTRSNASSSALPQSTPQLAARTLQKSVGTLFKTLQSSLGLRAYNALKASILGPAGSLVPFLEVLSLPLQGLCTCRSCVLGGPCLLFARLDPSLRSGVCNRSIPQPTLFPYFPF